MKPVLSAVALAALISAAAAGQDDGPRQLGAHVHGQARLSVAMDPSGLVYAELVSPAWNLYGFEGATQTEAQRETVQAVAAALNAGALITFPGRAGCTLIEHRLGEGEDDALSGDGEAPDAHDHNDHDAHDHDSHDHGAHGHDAHDHGDHDEHGHGDHSHDGHGHADVTVSWTYQCARAQAADRFEVQGLFDALPRLERVEAEAFDGRRAAVRTLTPGAAGLVLE